MFRIYSRTLVLVVVEYCRQCNGMSRRYSDSIDSLAFKAKVCSAGTDAVVADSARVRVVVAICCTLAVVAIGMRPGRYSDGQHNQTRENEPRHFSGLRQANFQGIALLLVKQNAN